MELIHCQNLSFSYPGCDRQVLQDLTFSIDRSQFVLVCGKSGCGKSTLLRHFKKNLMPYGNLTGHIRYGGQEIESLDNVRNAWEIGFVRQDPENQIVTDKVWHELAFGLESLGLDNQTIKQRVAEMASFFGIQSWFRKSVHELSGGQKQLLNLASIMVMKPNLLVLDEPTSQLDPIAASDFLATLKKINTELGTTIVISEHRLEELFPLVDQIMVMSEGAIALLDTPQKTANKMASGICSDLFCTLPAVVKIAGAIAPQEISPLTVREGRLWLEQRLGIPASVDKTIKSKLPANPLKKQSASPILSMKEVWFRYPKANQDTLRGVSLDIPQGQLFSILGGNGVGKSTTLKALTRLIKPQHGTIMFQGTAYHKLTDQELFHHGLSMLPQNPQALFTEITVVEELQEAFSDQKNISESQQSVEIATMITEMQLQGLETSHPYDLSGGEQQRLALGKLLLRKPTILLLDEPTKGLDGCFKETLAALFHKLCDQGVTIVMVTHDIEFSAKYADLCGLFFDGEIVSCGSPTSFFSGNTFYTTAANRVAGQWFPTAVTWEEVVAQWQEATQNDKL